MENEHGSGGVEWGKWGRPFSSCPSPVNCPHFYSLLLPRLVWPIWAIPLLPMNVGPDPCAHNSRPPNHAPIPSCACTTFALPCYTKKDISLLSLCLHASMRECERSVRYWHEGIGATSVEELCGFEESNSSLLPPLSTRCK